MKIKPFFQFSSHAAPVCNISYTYYTSGWAKWRSLLQGHREILSIAGKRNSRLIFFLTRSNKKTKWKCKLCIVLSKLLREP